MKLGSARFARRWLGHLSCLACLGSAACESRPASTTAASASARRDDGATSPWTIGGRAVGIVSSLAVGTVDQLSWRLSISNGPLSCGEIATNYPARPSSSNKHTRLDMWLVQALQKDGHPGAWSFRSAFFSDERGVRGVRAQGSLLKSVSQQAERLVVEDLELALQDHRGGGRLINYSGDLDAKACPRIARSEKDRPQAKFSLRVAQTVLPVRGATLRPEGANKRLRLTGVPHDCLSTFTQGYDWSLDVVIGGEPQSVTLISLQGDRFLDGPARSRDLQSISVELKNTPQTTRIDLQGAVEVAGFPLTLRGELDVEICPLAPKK
jgi:hypothetical protein